MNIKHSLQMFFGLRSAKKSHLPQLCKGNEFSLCVCIEGTFAKKKILSKAVKIPINIYSSLLLYTTDRFKCCCDSTNSLFFPLFIQFQFCARATLGFFFSSLHGVSVCELFGLLFYSMMFGVCCLNLSIVYGQQQ